MPWSVLKWTLCLLLMVWPLNSVISVSDDCNSQMHGIFDCNYGDMLTSFLCWIYTSAVDPILFQISSFLKVFCPSMVIVLTQFPLAFAVTCKTIFWRLNVQTEGVVLRACGISTSFKASEFVNHGFWRPSLDLYLPLFVYVILKKFDHFSPFLFCQVL